LPLGRVAVDDERLPVRLLWIDVAFEHREVAVVDERVAPASIGPDRAKLIRESVIAR
jgi:hypothetical protein